MAVAIRKLDTYDIILFGKQAIDGDTAQVGPETAEHLGVAQVTYEKCFAYVVNTACDRHNFILDFDLVPGNIHDSVMFDGLYERLVEEFPQMHAGAVDAGY